MSNQEFIIESVQILNSLTQEQYEEVKVFLLSRLSHHRDAHRVSRIIFKMAEECISKLLEMKDDAA